MRTAANSLNTLRGTIFSIAVRRALTDYLLGVGLVLFVLLMVAWTIDLARTFPAIRATADLRDVPLVNLLAPYLLQRGVDIVARLLPMACFFGVFLAELARRNRLESIIIAASGATPARMLTAVLWFGLIAGSAQTLLESRWRPAAVMAQVDSGLGDYAVWYRRGWLNWASWFVEDDIAIRAVVRRTAEPELRDVLVFEGIRDPRLRRAVAAERAYPTPKPFVWALEEVRIWKLDNGNTTPLTQPTLEMRIDLIPEQLSYIGVPEINIPTTPLMAIAARPGALNASGIATAVWRRRTAGLLPIIAALLAVALASRTYEGRVLVIPRTIAMAAVGYVLMVSIKVFWELGNLGAIWPVVAVLAPLTSILAIALLISFPRPLRRLGAAFQS